MSWAREPGPDGRPKGWWAKTALAGLIGGLAMAAFLMAAYSAWGLGAFFPINGIATVLPPFQPPPGSGPSPDFAGAATVTGGLLHLVLSAALGVIFGGIVEAFMPERVRSKIWGPIAGMGYSVFVWMFLGYGGIYLAGLQLVFGTATFFLGHLVYGAALGLSLALLTRKQDLVTITFAPEEKRVAEPLERR